MSLDRQFELGNATHLWKEEASDSGLLAELGSALRFRSLSDLNSVVLRDLSRFARRYDLIAGIPRSGMLLASLMGLYLNLPVISVDGLAAGLWSSRYTGRRLARNRPGALEPKSVLVADDSVSTGETMAAVRSAMAAAPLSVRAEYLAAFATKSGSKYVDHYLELVELLRVFEWNLLHHSFHAVVLRRFGRRDLPGSGCSRKRRRRAVSDIFGRRSTPRTAHSTGGRRGDIETGEVPRAHGTLAGAPWRAISTSDHARSGQRGGSAPDRGARGDEGRSLSLPRRAAFHRKRSTTGKRDS